VNLEYQLDQGKTTTQLGANASTEKCRFGAKCWTKDCSKKHPANWTPKDPREAKCDKCDRTGHTTEEHGKCFKCKKFGHYSSDCKSGEKVQQNAQVVELSADGEELYSINADGDDGRL